MEDVPIEDELSMQKRYGSENTEFYSKYPIGFAEASNRSVSSQQSREAPSLDHSTSSFSDQFRSYTDRVSTVTNTHEPTLYNDRVAGRRCRNCLIN